MRQTNSNSMRFLNLTSIMLILLGGSCKNKEHIEEPIIEKDYSSFTINELEQALIHASDQEKLKIYWELIKNIGYEKKKNIISYVNKLEKLAKEINNKKYEGKAIFARAYTYNYNGDYINALLYYEAALTFFKNNKDDSNTGSILNNIGSIYEKVEDYEKASEYRIKSLAYFQKIGDKKKEALVCGNIGHTYEELKRYQDAISYLSNAIKLYKDLNIDKQVARNYNRLGAVYYNLNQYTKAREYYELAKPYMKGHILNNIGETYLAEKNYGMAQKVLNEAWQHKETNTSDYESLAETLIQLGKLNDALGKYKKSAVYYNEAINLNDGTYSVRMKEALILALNNPYIESNKVNIYTKMLSNIHEEELTIRESLNSTSLNLAQQNKQQEINQLQQQTTIHNLQIQQKNIFIILAVIGIGIAIAFTVFYSRQTKMKALNKEAAIEQKLLRTQMNPHFISNALVSIEKFIYTSSIDEAGKYLTRFSKLMRRTLENSRMTTISLHDEVETLQHYLELQKLRYGNKFDYEIEVDKKLNLEEVYIPPMFGQPIIENAIEHGLAHKEEKGSIKVSFLKHEGLITLSVEDNGIGRQEAMKFKESNHQSLSTSITTERIALMNMRNAKRTSFDLQDILDNAQNVIGTRAVFRFPV